MQALKEQHEQHIEQLYLESRNKIEYYKDQLEQGALSPTKKIDALQAHIKEHEREKEKMLSEFASFKEMTAEKESELKARHVERIKELAEEMRAVKNDFETRLALLETLREQLATERQSALEKLQERHQVELDAIRANESKLQEELMRVQRVDAERLQADIARLSSEKRQLVEEHEAKLAKAQAFYEKELNALHNAQDATNEERYVSLRGQYDELRKGAERSKEEHRKREQDLLHQLAVSEEELEKLKKELHHFQNALQGEESKSSVLQQQVRLCVCVCV